MKKLLISLFVLMCVTISAQAKAVKKTVQKRTTSSDVGYLPGDVKDYKAILSYLESKPEYKELTIENIRNGALDIGQAFFVHLQTPFDGSDKPAVSKCLLMQVDDTGKVILADTHDCTKAE